MGRGTTFILALLAWAGGSYGADGVLFDAGVGAAGISPGNNGTLVRTGLVWEWDQRWLAEGDWTLSGRWELSVGTLQEEEDPQAKVDRVLDLGIGAMLRYANYYGGGTGTYLELGLGPHWLSETELDGVDISTHLQFTPTAGLGQRFGERGRYELGYRILHLSNGGIERPNPGLNYHLVHLGYRF